MRQEKKGSVKDRQATEARIVAAFKELIEERGVRNAGVNAVAEKAGVNKVLIYRYFGGMEGLCARLAAELDPSSLNYAERIALTLDPEADIKTQLVSGLRDFQRRLAKDEFSLALMTEELSGENELTKALAAARERTGSALGAIIEERLEASRMSGKTKDVQARLAVVSAALYYLTLRARGVRLFNSLDIGGDDGWERLYEAMADMVLGG